MMFSLVGFFFLHNNGVDLFFDRSDGDGTDSPLLAEETDPVDSPHSPNSKHNHSRPYINPHGSHSHHHDKAKALTKYGELVILG